VNLARVNLERAKKLAEAGVIAKSDLDNAQTNYDTAVAQLKSLEHQVEQQKVELRYYKVSSPMDGIVGDIPVRVGDRVIVSTLLTTVDEPGALEAYLYIPAARAKDLRALVNFTCMWRSFQWPSRPKPGWSPIWICPLRNSGCSLKRP